MSWLASCASVVEKFENREEEKDDDVTTTSVAEEDQEDEDGESVTTSVAESPLNNSKEILEDLEFVNFTMDGDLLVKVLELGDDSKTFEALDDESKNFMNVIKEGKSEDEFIHDYIKDNFSMNLEPSADAPEIIVFTDKTEEETKGDKFKFKFNIEELNENETDITEPFVGSRVSNIDVKFLLKAVLFSCLFYLLAHNDSKKFVVNLLKIRKSHYLYVGMALFFVIYLCLNLIV